MHRSAHDGLISGQEDMGQAAGSVYGSVVRQAEAQFKGWRRTGSSTM
jgi:hypothetical protein